MGDRKSSLLGRLFWAVVTGGITLIVLASFWPELDPPIIAAATGGGAILGALLGPFALDLVSLAS